MDTLFALPEQLSPRLAWLRSHCVRTARHDSGGEYPPWYAFLGDEPDQSMNTGEGETEDEAIVALAKQKGWRLWNEQSAIASVTNA